MSVVVVVARYLSGSRRFPRSGLQPDLLGIEVFSSNTDGNVRVQSVRASNCAIQDVVIFRLYKYAKYHDRGFRSYQIWYKVSTILFGMTFVLEI